MSQKQQTSTACEKNKQKNRTKRSEDDGPAVNAEAKEPCGIASKTKPSKKKTPLQTSVEHLQTAQKPAISVISRKSAGSNWETVSKGNEQTKLKSNAEERVAIKSGENSEVSLSKSARLRQKRRAAEQKYVAIDCEMVGVGINGQDDMLARVSIVGKRGNVLLDKFVKPQETVTDYRTKFSGIRPHDINDAEDFKIVQEEVVQILQGKILVGHGINNDLAVLRLKHPQNSIRDTSRYKPLCRSLAYGRTPSLKRITLALFGKEIQTGEHNSIEDARAAMNIYKLLAPDWEACLKKRQQRAGK